MKLKNKTSPEKVVKYFKQAFENGNEVNYKTPKGYIYTAGKILMKLEGKDNYVVINKKWVKI